MTPLFWIVVWPLSKVLARRWPLMMSRGITRALGTFPKYEPSAADVFVCSYFKSGTNWTMHIALQIAFRGSARFEHVHDLVAWPEIPPRMRMAVPVGDGRPRAASPTGLRVIKTHLALCCRAVFARGALHRRGSRPEGRVRVELSLLARGRARSRDADRAPLARRLLVARHGARLVGRSSAELLERSRPAERLVPHLRADARGFARQPSIGSRTSWASTSRPTSARR